LLQNGKKNIKKCDPKQNLVATTRKANKTTQKCYTSPKTTKNVTTKIQKI
jgi:hypothetical protein